MLDIIWKAAVAVNTTLCCSVTDTHTEEQVIAELLVQLQHVSIKYQHSPSKAHKCAFSEKALPDTLYFYQRAASLSDSIHATLTNQCPLTIQITQFSHKATATVLEKRFLAGFEDEVTYTTPSTKRYKVLVMLLLHSLVSVFTSTPRHFILEILC